MKWIKDYQLFLFDFDGLLVNTEELHFRAYKKMLADRGVELTWDFPYYCFLAHDNATRFKTALFKTFPELLKLNWQALYNEKKKAMLELLNQTPPALMPGAKTLLQKLADRNICACVVTNSPKSQIELIKAKHPILDTIKHWFTRETYKEPKPNPACYLTAISALAKNSDKIIGFEDTPRGLKALLQTRARPVLISKIAYPAIEQFKKQGSFLHFSTLCDLPKESLQVSR